MFNDKVLPMVWDYAEANPFPRSSGSWIDTCIKWIVRVLNNDLGHGRALVELRDAASMDLDAETYVYSTDPPYYDNQAYADLADFFYIWLRRGLQKSFPDVFSTVLTSKAEELVATPIRHGEVEKARDFFLESMSKVLQKISSSSVAHVPVTLYYAFKQNEVQKDGVVSTGWVAFLEAVAESGLQVEGTWPMRTERAARTRGLGSNALASSIVLVCRKRLSTAETITRRDFLAALKRELPGALRMLQHGNIAPVDLAQAAIGPGMAVFSRYAAVLEADGSPMSVRSALIEINRVLDEVLAEQEGDMDGDTRFCVAWFEQYGTRERPYGEAEVLFTAKNTSYEGLRRAGVIHGANGKVRLKARDELDPGWDPTRDVRPTDWECVQHLVRALVAETGGGVAEAARLVQAMGPGRAENARALAYRLFTVAERKGWTEEALAYNILVTSWPQIQAQAAKLPGPAQAELGV